MASSPTVRQKGGSSTTAATSSSFDTGQLTLEAGGAGGNALAGSDLIAFMRTNANVEANVTPPAGWTVLAAVHSTGSGSPILWVLYKHQASAGPITGLSMTQIASSPVHWHVYEIVGAATALTPYDTPASDSTATIADTTASVGPIATPRSLPGLALAAVGWGGGSGNPGTPSWSNGYTQQLATGSGPSLATAKLAHAGSGPFNTTATFVAGQIPRIAIVNFAPDPDPVGGGGGGGVWTVGLVA